MGEVEEELLQRFAARRHGVLRVAEPAVDDGRPRFRDMRSSRGRQVIFDLIAEITGQPVERLALS